MTDITAAPEGDLKYEVHEYMPGSFVWHVFVIDGQGYQHPVAAWNDGYGVVKAGDALADGTIVSEDTAVVNGMPVAQARFRTELAAYEYVRDNYPDATCLTSFSGGHPDPAIRAIIEG